MVCLQVRLEDVEHSGSGEEVEWAPATAADMEAASHPPVPAAAAGAPQSLADKPAAAPGGVVGKTASAPRPPLGRSAFAPPANPGMSPDHAPGGAPASPGVLAPSSSAPAPRCTPATAEAPAADERGSEPSWRGRSRSSGAQFTMNQISDLHSILLPGGTDLRV